MSGVGAYVCHPILRDHFRQRFLERTDRVALVADLLLGPPEVAVRQDDIPVIATAVEVLLEAGEYVAANDVFTSRFQDGQLFLTLGTPKSGLSISRAFVASDGKRQALESVLGLKRVASYVSAVALFADFSGEQDVAITFHRMALSICERTGVPGDLSICLRNFARTELSTGQLSTAAQHLFRAHQEAAKTGRHDLICMALADIGHVESSRGDIFGADRDFSLAKRKEIEMRSSTASLHSLRGVRWAWHLMRTQDVKGAVAHAKGNRVVCSKNHRLDQVALCDWLLGHAAVLSGDFAEADRLLSQAESSLQESHMLHDLAGVHVSMAESSMMQGHYDESLLLCDRAADIAAPRNFRLLQADALVVRSRVAYRRSQYARARESAEEALNLAQACDYAGAKSNHPGYSRSLTRNWT